MRLCPRSNLGVSSVVLAALAGVSATAVSCAHTRPAEHAITVPQPHPAAIPRRVVGPSRWFPVVDSSEPRLVEQDPDRSLRLVERGLRLVEYPDGRIVRAEEILPSDGVISSLRLPPRLGSGILFSVVANGATRLYRARDWTSTLQPLVRLPFETAQFVAGFDRLYAVSTRTHAAVGVDPVTGSVLAASPLPPTSGYGALAFSDGWVGAVDVDLRGVLVTFDAGSSFHPLRAPTAPPGVYEQAGRVVLSTPRGGYALEPNGELERIDGPSESDLFTDPGRGFDAADDDAPLDEPTIPFETSALGGRPLEVAVLRGYPDTTDTAVVLANGTLARVGLRDGRVIASVAHAAPVGATCVGERLFSGIGFVCGDDVGPTRIFAYRPPLALDPVFEFPEPRTVSKSESGALVIHGGCPLGSGPRADAYCIIPSSGKAREISLTGDVGAARVAVFADGRAVVLTPPGLGREGTLTLVLPDGTDTSKTLSLVAVPSSVRELLRRGLWQDGWVEIEPGVLAGWVVGGTSFVGVRVESDGKVTAGTVRTDAPRASFSGSFALVTDARGSGYESTDGGANWAEMGLPVPADVIADAPADRERGCSAVGCGLGSWLRVGWGKGRGKSDLALATEPPKPTPDPITYVTWSLSCSPTGETETPANVAVATDRTAARPRDRGRGQRQPSAAPRASTDAETALDSSAWRTFLGAAGPDRGSNDLGFDFGTEDRDVQLRGYAWGARGAEWDRVGSWLVRVANRWRVRGTVWSTALSRAPWADASDAAAAFGSEPTHRVSNEWYAALDPLEEGGVLFVRTGSATELSVVERGRAIVTPRVPDDFILDRPDWGAVKVSGKWYLGAAQGQSFQIFGIEGGTVTRLGAYPRHTDNGFARVVRTAHGDALGIWVKALGQRGTTGGGDTWFIHPVDEVTGLVGEPLVVPHDAFAHPPRPCEPDENGWILEYEVSPSVAKLELINATEAPAVTKVEARLIAGPGGLCIDALAARTDSDPPKTLRSAKGTSRPRRGTPLTLTDRATDRRWGFHCVPE